MKHDPNYTKNPSEEKRVTISKSWYQRIELKDIILTAIAFISIMVALSFAAKVRDFYDLSLNPNDILVTEGEDNTLDLWIRQKNGIESVMITKQIIDYGTGTGHYACIDPRNLLASEGEMRVSDGVLLKADEQGTPLVDSTTQLHPRLGAAYHLRIPRELLYQTGDGNYHATTLYDGSPLTITAFRKDYADYNGEYRINPFTLHAAWWPADEPYYGANSLDAIAKLASKEVYSLEERLRNEFNAFLFEESERYNALKDARIEDESALNEKIAKVQSQADRLSTIFQNQLALLRTEGFETASSLQKDIEILREESVAKATELDSKIEVLAKEEQVEEVLALVKDGSTKATELDNKIEALTREGQAEAIRLDSEIDALRTEGVAKATELDSKVVNLSRDGQAEAVRLDSEINTLKTDGITKATELDSTMQTLFQDGEATVASLSDKIVALREDGVTKALELDSTIDGLVQAREEETLRLSSEIESLRGEGITAIAELDNTIQALKVEGLGLASILREERTVIITSLKKELVQIQQTLRNLESREVLYAPTGIDDTPVDAPILLLELQTTQEETGWSSGESLLQSSSEWRFKQLISADIRMKEEAVTLINKLYVALNVDLQKLDEVSQDETTIKNLVRDPLVDKLKTIVSNVSSYSPETRLKTRYSLVTLQGIVGQLADQAINSKTAYLSSLDQHREVNASVVKKADESIIVNLENFIGSVNALLNTLRMYNAIDTFSSIEGIDTDGIESIITMKNENTELTQNEAIARAAEQGYVMSSYEMFLIFNVFFNQDNQ